MEEADFEAETKNFQLKIFFIDNARSRSRIYKSVKVFYINMLNLLI